MSQKKWNTILERDRFHALSEMCMRRIMEEGSADESSDSELDDLLEATLWYGVSLTRRLESRIDFGALPLRVVHLSDVECINNFRFRRDDMQQFFDLLRPKMVIHLNAFVNLTGDTIVRVHNRYKIPFETGMLMVLFRLSRPMRVRSDMEARFCCRRTRISAILRSFVPALYSVSLLYLSDPTIYYERFGLYAEKIAEKSGNAATNVWGFIDGTVKKIARPSRNQRAAYSGHKRLHAIKFQNVTTPDGMIANLFGPIAGRHHDSFMLGESGLLEQMQNHMPVGGDNPIYSLFGDPAYPQSAHLFGGFHGAQPGSIEAAWNTEMARSRIAVEWTFGEVTKQFRGLGLKSEMSIYRVPVAQYYSIAVFLVNCRNSLYGSQTSTYFNCQPYSLENYMNLVD